MSLNQYLIDPGLQEFVRIMHLESKDISTCEAECKQALEEIADDLRLGRVNLTVHSPSSKLHPEGLDLAFELYQYEGSAPGAPYDMNFPFPDNGTCSYKVCPRDDKPFTEGELLNVEYVFTEIYQKFNRSVMMQIMNRVISTDLDTGAASISALMQHAGSLIGRGMIDQYIALFYNVHNFRYVNKIFSYATGDVVLRKYTQTVLSRLSEGEILARLGGDNYTALIKKEHAQDFMAYIRALKLTHEAESKEHSFLFGATIGYATLENVHSPRDIMSRVSVAYQSARRMGAGSLVKYSDKLMHQLMARQEILASFHRALSRREFAVYYQPKVNIEDKKICGAEALVRWIQGDKVIPPMEFIPILEEEGSICSLDFYVLREVCAFLRERIDQGLEPVRISVNFSRRHLEDADLLDKTVEIIDWYHLDHDLIEIELTESNDYQNYGKIRDIVNEFRTNGIMTSMDDFGTGFSSLNMIKEVNLDMVKIDKSLIPLDNDDPDKKRDLILFENLIRLVHQLSKKAVAEGVETPEQLQCVTDAGCKIIQGYIFDKPLPKEDFNNRLRDGYSKN